MTTALKGLIVDFGGVLTDLGGVASGRPPLVGVVLAARSTGIRTALLSNANPPSESVPWLESLFDVVVFSGAVGVAKPDRRSYLITVRRLGLRPAECVFVDDLAANVRGAVAAGLVGVHHVSVSSTLDELATLLGLEYS
ncbi:MAG: HAD-IA family hydrolase [Kutzneria sp.]|nr:HAD-IA family hydrolase [Kutzneria sp.]